uniref:Transposase n=1 Tax=Oryza sativa subsp. indica TaxID=39946 RepID=A0A386CB17_ORYSI|nr:transposase [Oryza sativa Indica Group]
MGDKADWGDGFFKNCATSLGWDEAKQTIVCSPEWWEEHLARCNNCEKGIKCNHVKFRKQGPKFLDDLHIIFGKSHVSGASASCPGDVSSDEASDDDVAEVPKPAKTVNPGKNKRKGSSTIVRDKDEKSPFARMYKNTCLKIETAAEKICTSVEASSASPCNVVPTIKEAMKMVKDCGVEEKTALMHTATTLFMKPEFREMDGKLVDVAKEGQKGLLMLADLAQHASIMGEMANLYTERYLQKGAYRQTPETGIQWVMRLMDRPRYFYKMFRMSPEIFHALHDLLVSTYGLSSSNNVSSIESLTMFLWIVGGPQSFSQVESHFTRSLWTVHTKFHEVLKCLRKLAKNNITPRDTTFSTEHGRLREDRFWPYFKDAIGAIDGSHISVVVLLDETISHTCHHGYTSQNVLAICDFDMRFIFAVAGWPGSAHDSRILSHALANFPSFPMPPTGKYYLVDSGYPNRIGYLAPFKGTTYHIPEFRHRSGPPQGKYEVFNFLHSSLRNVIERSFGVLKQKWRILKGIPSFSPTTQKHIIMACLALHNFVRDSNLRDKEFERCDADEDYLLEDTSDTSDDESEDAENDDTMNTIRTRIADALISARGG